MYKLRWLPEEARKQLIRDWCAWSRQGMAFLLAPMSDVDKRPSRMVTMAPESVRVMFIQRWLATGTVSHVLTLYPMCERLTFRGRHREIH